MDEGPVEELTRTANAQPALLVMGTLCAEELQRRGHNADMVAGHSLGEYTALVHASAMGFADAIELVRVRGQLMEQAVRDTPGKMAAVIGVALERLEEIVSECAGSGVLTISNRNAPTQMVLSGQTSAVQKAMDLINEARLGKAIELEVSAPFHCALMRPMAEAFAQHLSSIPLNPPQMTFFDNVTGLSESDPERIREKLVAQLTAPVLWARAVQSAYDAGARLFIESGPRKVLTGLAKRIVRKAKRLSAEDLCGR
jgi:[acyl-carrier-protein] S-malonyltransferase